MSKSTVFIITFLFIGTAVTLILSIVTGKEYNRSSLMDAWFIGGLMVVIDIFLSFVVKKLNLKSVKYRTTVTKEELR